MFIEVTLSDERKKLVNIARILSVEPDTSGNGIIIFCEGDDDGNGLSFINVDESYGEVKDLISRVSVSNCNVRFDA